MPAADPSISSNLNPRQEDLWTRSQRRVLVHLIRWAKMPMIKAFRLQPKIRIQYLVLVSQPARTLLSPIRFRRKPQTPKQHGSKLVSIVRAQSEGSVGSEVMALAPQAKHRRSSIGWAECSIAVTRRMDSEETLSDSRLWRNGEVQSLCASRSLIWSSIAMALQRDLEELLVTTRGGSSNSAGVAVLQLHLQ